MAENVGKRLEQKESKQKKAKKPSRLTKGQKWLLAVAIVLAVVLVAVVALDGLFVKPELPGKGNGSNADGTQAGDGIDYGDGVQPRVSGERKSKDYYTVLILGRDTGGGGNTDTMLLASYDVTNQKANVMSIPRDTMVNVNWDVKKINSVYNMNGGGEKGIKALYKEISQLVGFEPDYQVILEWEAVGKIVDAIGGVDFDVPYPMDYHDPAQNLVIEQAPGLRHLSGDDAMQVIRWRKNDKDSPYGYNKGGVEYASEILSLCNSMGEGWLLTAEMVELIRTGAPNVVCTQPFACLPNHVVGKAVIKEMMQPKNVLNIGKIAKVFEESVETDLSFQNILWFGKRAFSGGLSMDDVNFMTMPYKGAAAYSRVYSKQLGTDFYLEYVVPIPGKLLDIVNNQLSPFKEIFTLSDLDIMSVNADGSISSTTGHVEDSKAAVPPTLMGSGKKDEPEKDYITDENGNLIDPDTGEIVTPPEETEPGTETPSETPSEPTPETPATPETPGTGTETTDPSGSTGGETGTGSPETPDQPEDPGIIVVPPEEPATPDANQGLDPVTGEPLPMDG